MKEPSRDLEARMSKISLLTSAIGLGLMAFGFADMLIHGASLSIPGTTALSLPAIESGAGIPLSLLAMSAGIVVLALLPVVRVLQALSLYARKGQLLNAVVALLVLIELVVSARAGG
jgi:uncharacterized membrane protein